METRTTNPIVRDLWRSSKVEAPTQRRATMAERKDVERLAESDLRRLSDFIGGEIPRTKWTIWPGGWPDQIEAALIDAVVSIRAKYGSPTNGVRGAVARYKESVGDPAPNALSRLALFDPADLQKLLGNQLTSGRTKASAITEAATNLVNVGVCSAADLDPRKSEQKRAYTAVHGLSSVTWEYFGMLLSIPGVKADTWTTRFVSRAMGREVNPNEARTLLLDVSSQLEVNPTDLDHAIWDHERNRRPEPEPEPAPDLEPEPEAELSEEC